MKKRLLVSACLLGVNCKYNGENNRHEKVLDRIRLDDVESVIPVCPEQLGGLTTPRSACEIDQGEGRDVLLKQAKIMNKDGEDVTALFVKGAEETLQLVKLFDCNTAILKERSPSCGVHKIYNGCFDSTLIQGSGVLAALLKQNGLTVISEEDLD